MIQMTLKTDAKLEAGQPTLLQFIPRSTNAPGARIALETVHTQKLHLIIVSEDLSFFSHQHPREVAGRYELEFTFPRGGRYLLYADYQPIGSAGIVDQLLVVVAGDAAAPAVFTREQLSATRDGLRVVLDKTDLSALKALVYRNGVALPASRIDDFLGAKAHVVMIHTEDKDFLHVHPMVHDDELVLHARFRKKGVYRAWVQLLVDGRPYTTDFVLQAEALPHPAMAMHHH